MISNNIYLIYKFCFFLFICKSFSQNHTITGVVFDDKEKPLESANIIAKPLTEKATLLSYIKNYIYTKTMKINSC
jgi:hypothetical protein